VRDYNERKEQQRNHHGPIRGEIWCEPRQCQWTEKPVNRQVALSEALSNTRSLRYPEPLRESL
jgi:hypothetical protein